MNTTIVGTEIDVYMNEDEAEALIRHLSIPALRGHREVGDLVNGLYWALMNMPPKAVRRIKPDYDDEAYRP